MKTVSHNDIIRYFPGSPIKQTIADWYPPRFRYSFRDLVECATCVPSRRNATINDLLAIGLTGWFLDNHQMRGFALRWAGKIIDYHQRSGIPLNPINHNALRICGLYHDGKINVYDLDQFSRGMIDQSERSGGRLTSAIYCAMVDSSLAARGVIFHRYIIEQLHDTLQMTEE